MTAARTAFASATFDRPNTAAEDVYWSQSLANLDGWIAVYGWEHNLPVDESALTFDISNVDGALREEGAYLTSALIAQGYSSGVASAYSAQITGINPQASAELNSQLDSIRATQWIQGLNGIAQGAAGSAGYSNLQPQSSSATKQAISDELSTVLFSNAFDSGQLLKSLIEHTLGPADDSNPANVLNAASSAASSSSGNVSLYV